MSPKFIASESSLRERELWPRPARIVAFVVATLGALLWPIIAFR